jgi:hypothetical protein
LHPFFHTLLKSSLQTSQSSNEINSQKNGSMTTMDEALAFIDKIVETDFLEPIPKD